MSALVELINATPNDSACPELIDRLWRRDTTLWSSDPGQRRAIENRLGWLDAAAFMDQHSGRIVDFAERLRSEGYQQAVLLGMGGSSLAPEVYAALHEAVPPSIALTVLDSTSPRYVRQVTERCQDADTLFIVASKSGTTAETAALDAHFFEWMRSRSRQPSKHFVAITDPGSPLESLARERGYRETFLNPADIGGRFSALSFFGLVPAALVGVDLQALRAPLPDSSASPVIADGCRLGTVLGTLARDGRNKLTLHCSPAIAPLTAWIEQLIDESTGKHGTGILAVPAEDRWAPQAYCRDRIFAVIDYADEPIDDAWVSQLAGLGHPVARWRLTSLHQLGGELYKWEIATALAGRELGINPFDEPDVNDSKAMTRRILEQPARTFDSTPQSWSSVAALLDTARAGDFVAVLAYVPPNPENRHRLRDWSASLGRRTGLPCCIGFGPRYLHSSGQLHKGGPDQGLFIVVTLDSQDDLPIPGQPHGFKSLFDAQARGDLRVLRERGRRVVHVEAVERDGGLEALIQATP